MKTCSRLLRRNARAAAILALIAILPAARANDSAASSAAGGIQLKREPRISMVKEKLTISTNKITVEYEFINESDQDITTEVAFPIPAYEVTMSAGGIRDFDDFRVWVEGTERKYKTQAKAMLKSKDYSTLLLKYGVDIPSLGHFEDKEEPLSRDFRKLTKPVQEQLIKAGLFDRETQFPTWSVEKTYYWQQTFPAHKVLHVRHEYEPGIGFQLVEKEQLNAPPVKTSSKMPSSTKNGGYPPPDQFAREVQNACIDSRLKNTLLKSIEGRSDPGSSDISMAWVDYILLTANNWKRPIKNFELIVEKNSREDYPTHFVSFCWEGKVERIGQNGFKATATNFVPKTDLHVAFFDIPKSTQ